MKIKSADKKLIKQVIQSKNIKCPLCFKLTTKRNLKRHLELVHRETPKYVREFIFKHHSQKEETKVINQENIEKVLKDVAQKRQDEDEDEIENKKTCIYCFRRIHPNSLVKHYRRAHTKQYEQDQMEYLQECSICDKKLVYVAQHKYKVHGIPIQSQQLIQDKRCAKKKKRLQVIRSTHSKEIAQRDNNLMCINDYVDYLKLDSAKTTKNIVTIQKTLIHFEKTLAENKLDLSIIFSSNEDQINQLISLIKQQFQDFSDGTNYTYSLYVFNFVNEIVKRVPERPHVHFLSLYKIHIKNLRKNANKERINKQLENQRRGINKETVTILDADFIDFVQPHINERYIPLFNSVYNRCRVYGSLILRISLLTGIRASALSNFKKSELTSAAINDDNLYMCMVKEHKTSTVYGSQPIPLPPYLYNTLKNMTSKKDSEYVFSKLDDGGQLSVPDIDGILIDYQRKLNVPSLLTLVMVRRYFTDVAFSSSDKLKTALQDLLRHSEKTQSASYKPIASKKRASYAAKTLQELISKDYLSQNQSNVSYIRF